MIKRFIFVSIVLLSFYIFFLIVRLNLAPQSDEVMPLLVDPNVVEEPTQKVYSFSFAKYTPDGKQELQIEGDSADIFAKVVTLSNVIAKAYANEKPITITADEGFFNKETSEVLLSHNVVATSEEGATLLSDSLNIDINSRALATDDHAQLEKDNIRLEGDGARGNSNDRKIQFNKNVTVVISTEDKNAPPTIITCDGALEVDYVQNIAQFSKNVVATDSRGKLSADKMDVFYDKETRRVYKIIAQGNVIIEQDGNITYSDNVIYLANEGRVILGGDPEAVYYPESKPFENAQGSDESYLIFDSSVKK
jgi:LPS export ABC transporter protein LptC